MNAKLAKSITAFCLLVITGCGTQPEILKIRSLAEPIVVSEALDSNGDIVGLERVSKDHDGKIRANVLVIHGMGWTQYEKGENQFGFDVIQGIEKAYGVTGSLNRVTRLCRQTDDKGNSVLTYPEGGLIITGSSLPLRTDAPLTYLDSFDRACLDKIKIDLGQRGSINVYRLFWDDPFYDSYEYPHIGFDDDIFRQQEFTTSQHRGYEDISGLRSSLNKKLKRDVVTYGFSDATMYLGPVGQIIRETIGGGICAVINDATNQEQYFGEKPFKQIKKSSAQLCQPMTEGFKAPLVIVTKSLGSRVAFDVLTRDRTPELGKKLDLISNHELEVFMFANQIPLLGIGRLSEATSHRPEVKKNLKFVAISEINDLLTYELVPYFEHLYYLRCIGTRRISADNSSDCKTAGARERMSKFRNNKGLRNQFVSEIGFSVVDVRVKFAGSMIPFIPLAHPEKAHTGHMSAAPVRSIFLCGAHKGQALKKDDGCDAR